jgi:hypothetical protein
MVKFMLRAYKQGMKTVASASLVNARAHNARSDSQRLSVRIPREKTLRPDPSRDPRGDAAYDGDQADQNR